MKKTHHHSTALVILFILLLGTLCFSIKEGYQTFVLRNQVKNLQTHIGVLHQQAALNNQNIQLIADIMTGVERDEDLSE